VAGLIKAVLMLEHGAIPPSLHFVEPNPHIAWNETSGEGVDGVDAMAKGPSGG